jgi:hypothetical protein
MGRFLTRDTWPGEVNRPHSLNRWGYVEGNPINNIDPSGLCSQRGWNDAPGGLFSKEQCKKLENIYLDVHSGRRYDGLQDMQDWYYKLADRIDSDGNSQAAANLRHYLGGSGSTQRLSSEFMNKYIWEWGYVARKVKNLADWYIKSKISSCEPSFPFSIGPDIFATGIDVSLNNYDMWLLNINWPDSNQYGSLASFRLDVTLSGMVTRPWIGYSSNLNIHLTVLDYYDWHPGEKVKYPGPSLGAEIPDDWAYLLGFNPSGRSYGRPYLVRGDIDIPYEKNLWFVTSQDPNPPSGWYKASCIGIGFFNGKDQGCAP